MKTSLNRRAGRPVSQKKLKIMAFPDKLTYKMKGAGRKMCLLLCAIVMTAFSGCVMEETAESPDGDSFLYIRVAGAGTGNNGPAETRAGGGDKDTPDNQDYRISSLRVMAFKKNGGALVENRRYNMPADILRFPIDAGTYDFVFLANEPESESANLDGIDKFSRLKTISYLQSAFDADKDIPMMQTVKDVQALGNGSAKVNGGAAVNPFAVGLDRLGVRLDVTLRAKVDLGSSFEGIVLTGLSNRVPLTSESEYTGTVLRTTKRTIPASEFTSTTPTGENVWAVSKTKIILPASEFADTGDESKGVLLTLDMGEGKYSPSCKLKIFSSSEGTGVDNNYSLPKNTYLEFTGTITTPLEVNIKASEWIPENTDWEVPGHRTLSVSHTKVAITDLNGARISFRSNMPVVKVLPKVEKMDATLNEERFPKTNHIFNSIVESDDIHGGPGSSRTPARFNYTTTVDIDGEDRWSGSGYMDLVVDGFLKPDEDGNPNGMKVGNNVAGTYRLTLVAAESEDDLNNDRNVLRRDIIVTIEQNGERFQWYSPLHAAYDGATGYVGAFWRNDQYGERIITGQHADYGLPDRLVYWKAEVGDDPYGMVILSSTPSFDPKVGTDNPGDAEKYRVIPNSQKGEEGSSVEGHNRIYFRIGLKGTNPDPTKPRYATVIVTYMLWGGSEKHFPLYLRQGEEPDFLYANEGTRTGSRRFSVYNVTHQSFKFNPGIGVFSTAVTKTTTAHVDFPTQAGAHFQWAKLSNYGVNGGTNPLDAYNNYGYRAFNPSFDITPNVSKEQWGSTVYATTHLLWNNFKNTYEICPPGYRRPNDGAVTAVQANNTSTAALQSEMRASLLQTPMAGDGNEKLAGKTNYYKPQVLKNGLTFGFYADGYFDRRPIKRYETKGVFGVSLGNAGAAYWGCLFFNPTNNKSIFFPSAGRRSNQYHDAGTAVFPASGYYMTATSAPSLPGLGYTDYSQVWMMETNFIQLAPISTKFDVGMSLRCVKE